MAATVGANLVFAQNYEYDAASRLTSVKQGAQAVTMSYDSASRRTSLTLPNGVQTTYAYDPASRVTQILHQKTGTTLENVQYQYDPSGSRTRYQRTNPHPPLPPEVGATFDAANEMLSLNDKAFSYDFNGSLATRTDSCGATAYGWDGRNRLTGISGYKPDCTPLAASFKYDALGRRIEKTVNGQTMQYLYDGMDIAAEIQGGTITATYLRSLSIDEPFARTKGGTTSYYLQDALGSVIGLADGTGALATTYAYDAFGGTTATGALSDQPFKYTGREDDGTGLYYYRARYYSPEMRRFILEDPIGLDGGGHLFTYGDNAPTRFTDPTGLVPLVAAIPVCLANPACAAAIGAGVLATSIAINNAIMSSPPRPKPRPQPAQPPQPISTPTPSTPEECPDPNERCKKVRDYCIEECTGTLPTSDYGFTFWNCVNGCMKAHGCL